MKLQRNHNFLLFVLFLLSFRTHLTVFAADSINLGASLTGNQTIISRGGNFELGFFKPGKSQNHYIGIWYKKLTGQSQTVVWVANRDAPIPDPSSSYLTLLGNGNLVLFYQSNPPIWSTNSLNATEAVLGDDGNLVLRDGSNPSLVIWQSFDYPTDTYLPGGKIGFNKLTNKTWLLTSWRNREDPAPGMFTVELNPNGTRQTFIRWNKSVQVWTSGEWSEVNESYPSIPVNMTGNHIVNESFISNVNESYITYTLYDSSMLNRFVMDVSGQLKQYTWKNMMKKASLFVSVPEQFCDVYGVCGPFGNCNQDIMKCECLPGFVERSPLDWNLQGTTGGCVRNISLQCGKKDGFSPVSASNLPDDPVTRQVSSANECKLACESTCSCNAYAYRDSKCQVWDGDMLNVKQQSDGEAGDLFLKLSASDIRSSAPISQVRSSKATIWKIIIPVSILVASLMGVLGYIYLFKRNKASEKGKLKRIQGVLPDFLKTKAIYNNITLDTNLFINGKTEEETRELQIFDPACLAIATNNFSLANKLGEGGFGPVHKGKLENGQEIAVKRLSQSSGQGIEEFKNEITLISKLQHRNLVKLLGCCIEGDAKMLIYEYMPNKSLDAFLFDPRKKARLDWDTRFNIIGGIARGLLYLHRDSRLRVIHRDLKVSNILLDEDMNPKISDFGMARIFGGKQTIANTTRVVGTFGYMSPEYVTKGTFSEKSDVFSFGVLMLEILSSMRNNSFYDPEGPLNLLLHAWSLWNEGRWLEIVDEALGDAYRKLEVMKCLHIALLCVQNRAVDRPTMAEVDLMLSSETDRPSPKEPPFTTHPMSSSVVISNNNVSFTKVEGR